MTPTPDPLQAAPWMATGEIPTTEAAGDVMRLVDDWLSRPAVPRSIRDSIRRIALQAGLVAVERAALSAQSTPPALDVERLSKAMDRVSKAGGKQVKWGAGADSIAASIAREYAALRSPDPGAETT